MTDELRAMLSRAEIPAWIQAAAVVIGLTFAAVQLHMARRALESSADSNATAVEANRVQMAIEANGLLTTLNLVAIDLERHPEALDSNSTGYSPRERLFLLRLQYLERIFLLHEAGFLTHERWVSEQNYCAYVVSLPEFSGLWTRGSDGPGGSLREHFARSFASWIDEAANTSSN